MSALIKILVVVVALGAVGMVGYHYLVQTSTTVQVQVVPPTDPQPPARDHGDIDKLAPVHLPDARSPAQKAADAKQ